MRVPEFHLCSLTAGHVYSSDCWCEPVFISLCLDKDGHPVRVVEHNEVSAANHRDVMYARYQAITDPVSRESGVDDPWVTRSLEYVVPGGTEPNERNP